MPPYYGDLPFLVVRLGPTGQATALNLGQEENVMFGWLVAVVPVALILAAPIGAGAQTRNDQQRPKTDAELIQSAISAAPPAISQDATIINMEDNKVRTLRQGKNEYTCVPDDPSSPGNDPMCLDRNAMAWLQAWMGHKDAPKGKMGLVYMLQGGSDASNDDPFATSPPAGKAWVTTGPHVMVVGMAGMLDSDLPRAADVPTKPFVMWGGSSYEHIMMPVK